MTEHNAQSVRENAAKGEWTVDCPTCGRLFYIGKHEPVLCPKCQTADIDSEPTSYTVDPYGRL